MTRADLSPPPSPDTDAGGTTDVWAGRSVVLADGRTPAYGAEATLVEPGHLYQIPSASADALGRLHGRHVWRSTPALSAAGDPPGSTTLPVVVVRLPGAVGAAVVSPVDAIKTVLPPAVTAHGRVTVGGRDPGELRCRVRVWAAHQGLGNVDPYLSLGATPGQDGAFDLPVLSLGRYRVQAAVDGIWLSPTVDLDGGTPARLALDVPTAGGPVAVRVRDAAGRPATHVAVTLDLPAGPLTDQCWPAEVFTDGAGVETVPTLPAGPHVLHIAGRAAGPGDRPAPAVRRAGYDGRHPGAVTRHPARAG